MNLPAQPLIDALRKKGGFSKAAKAARVSEEDYERRRKQVERMVTAGTVSHKIADTICLDVLRVMPQDVYGEEWWK